MASQIINLNDYRPGDNNHPDQSAAHAIAPDRLWEYLARNLKINTADFPAGSGRKSI